MHSILGKGSFSRGVAWKRSAGGTAEALLSLQLVCFVGSTVSHLFLENIPYIPDGVQVRHVDWPIKRSNIMVSKPLGIGFGSVGRC